MTQYVERMRITAGAQSVRLSYRPLVVADGKQLCFGGRAGAVCQDRGGERCRILFSRAGCLGVRTAGEAGARLSIASVDVNMSNGELTFLQNFLGLNYNEAEITYTSGFVTVPVAIKVACAQVVKNAQATPADRMCDRTGVDALQMEYFSGVLIDAQVQSLLAALRGGEAGVTRWWIC